MNLNCQNDYSTLIAVDINESEIKDKKLFNTHVKDNNILFFINKDKKFDYPRIADYIKRFFETSKKNMNVDLNSFIQFSKSEESTYNLIQSIVIAASFYEKPTFSLKTKKDPIYDINFILDEKYTHIFNEVKNLKDAHDFCRKLQDMPSNYLFPTEFSKHVKELYNDISSKVTITEFNKKEIAEKNLNLILAVNAGSIREPRMMIIEYKNNNESNENYLYVGKGITFDSGGMNIKTGNYMRRMKFDMSGAATVISTIYALAKNNVKTNVIGIVCLTENLVSPASVRPDDVVVSYDGKTIEIDNTDAEGRLVLADGISYGVKNYNPTKVVDIATLTGAMIYSLGSTYSGVWSTCTCQWRDFEKIAKDSGEYVWRLPFHEDFLKPLESNIADICNSVSDPKAGSSRAACFLKEFTNDIPYIHLDVAATTDVKNIGQATLLKTLYNYAKKQN